MKQDTTAYDSFHSRPLPKWLTDQRDGLNTYQPEPLEMTEDNSLQISIIITAIIIVVTIVVLTIYFFYRNRKRL